MKKPLNKKFYRLNQYYSQYGLKITLLEYISKIAGEGIPYRINQYKHSVIKKYLERYYKDYQKYKEEGRLNLPKCNGEMTAWTIWWQGEEAAPEQILFSLMKRKENMKAFNQVTITADNYRNYIDVPEWLIEKWSNGVISFAHLSDVLRALLMSKWGGIWIDATNFPTKAIDAEAFNGEFLTQKQFNRRISCVSMGRWNVALLSGNNEIELFDYLAFSLIKFWEESDIIIDYFLMDYLIAVFYDNNSTFREIIDRMPETNPGHNDLERMLEKEYNEEKYDELCKLNNFVKLTYRHDFSRTTQAGHTTLYGHLMEEFAQAVNKEKIL